MLRWAHKQWPISNPTGPKEADENFKRSHWQTPKQHKPLKLFQSSGVSTCQGAKGCGMVRKGHNFTELTGHPLISWGNHTEVSAYPPCVNCVYGAICCFPSILQKTCNGSEFCYVDFELQEVIGRLWMKWGGKVPQCNPDPDDLYSSFFKRQCALRWHSVEFFHKESNQPKW